MKRNPATKRHIALSLCTGFALAVLAACGGSGSAGSGNATSAPAPTARVVPTMPAAQFAAPTTMIGSSSSETVTETEGVTGTEVIETPEPAAAEADLERGARIYASQNCAECHGAEGEGVADQGSAIAGTSLSEDDFTDLMRTGGGISRDHIYGPNAISPGGMTALHAWLQSLSTAE